MADSRPGKTVICLRCMKKDTSSGLCKRLKNRNLEVYSQAHVDEIDVCATFVEHGLLGFGQSHVGIPYRDMAAEPARICQPESNACAEREGAGRLGVAYGIERITHIELQEPPRIGRIQVDACHGSKRDIVCAVVEIAMYAAADAQRVEEAVLVADIEVKVEGGKVVTGNIDGGADFRAPRKVRVGKAAVFGVENSFALRLAVFHGTGFFCECRAGKPVAVSES